MLYTEKAILCIASLICIIAIIGKDIPNLNYFYTYTQFFICFH